MDAIFTPVVLLHTFAALAALVLGAGMVLARKGTFSHRVAGLFTLLPNRLLGRMLWSSLGLI